MQHYLVDAPRWLSQRRFLHALNYCMLLPGPEAQQLAIYTGWLLNGTPGGLVAGTPFVLPAVVRLLCPRAPPAPPSPPPCSCSPVWLPCSACPRSTSGSVTPPPSPPSSPASPPPSS